MKSIVVFLFLLLSFDALYGAKSVEVGERFQSSQKCKVCHRRIVDEWSSSWHARSHFNKDEYFRKSIEYISKKRHRSLNAVKVECATCHNPRISVTSTDDSYEIAAAMGLDKGSEVDKAVNDAAISEGINCVVCHNVDKIHDEYDKSVRGINRVEWTKSGTMTGPYKDAKSPYHKTKYHAFMQKDANQLCFVCHANDKSSKGLIFTDMQSEYKGKQLCVSCHMGKKHYDVAATYRFNGKEKKRYVRNHGFLGAHKEQMWKGALGIELKSSQKRIQITITNPQPHNIPSGFGSRELLVEVNFKDAQNKSIETKTLSLTTHYKRKRKRASIPHLAKEATKDHSIAAYGKKVLKIKKNAKAASVEVKLYYRLVNDEVRNLLKLQDPIFAKKFFIAKESLKF